MKTVAWDVDDTLNDFTHVWYEQWWIPRNKTSLNYSDLNINPPSSLLGITHSEYLASLDAFRASDDFSRVIPVESVLKWFQVHGETARHIVLTSPPMFAAPLSAAWLMKFFGKWIRSYNILPSARAGDHIPVYDISKTDFLKWFNKVDVLVEDNAENLQSATYAGIATIGIPQPWNKIEDSLDDALLKLTNFIQG